MFWNNGLTRSNETRLFLLATVMLSAMILPAFPIHPSLPSLRLEEMLLFGVFGLNVLAFARNKFRFNEQEKEQLQKQQTQLKLVFLLFGLLVASYTVSNIYGVGIRKAGYFGFRDLMELVTYFKYFLVITLTLSIDFKNEEFAFFKKVFLGGMVFLLIFSWGQHFNLGNMNTWFTPFFNQQHWDTLIYGNPPRVLGTFDNPNYFGVFTVIVLSYLVVKYFFAAGEDKFPWLLFIFIGLVIKLEFLTISRTALFCIALLFVIVCIWAFFYHRRSKKVLIKILALFLLTMVLFVTASDDFFYRLQEGLDFSESTSMQGHIERWGAAVGTIWESPILGWGTQKYVMSTTVDNEYILVTRRYGFVGLAIYLAFFLVPFVKGIIELRQRTKIKGKGAPYDRSSVLIGAYVAVLPTIFVFCIMAGIFYNLRLMTLFAISLGLVYNSLLHNTQQNNWPAPEESEV